jgi:hypothetical protein
MPKRLATRLDELELYARPDWLPQAQHGLWVSLSPSWQKFLAGNGGTRSQIETLLMALPEDKRQAVVARLWAYNAP